jgi:hypothetical protein
MRSFKELKTTKVADMTGEELEMFNRISGRLKEGKESGMFGTIAKGIRGTFRKIGDNFVAAAEETDRVDRKTRISSLKEELNDLEEAYTAGDIKEKKYNLAKATLENELEDLQ